MTLIPIEVLQKAEAAAPAVVAGAQCAGEIEIVLVSGVRLRVDAEVRRLAQLLRVKRKEIRRTVAIRCVLDTENARRKSALMKT
jgi:hypothetical protein